mmetsp:Transcript_42018/g.88174  ORF Transcript_42018/g.88174 Transcript_42018/m.88174 type:complete len:119 (+) Transcript_42018:1055-1411(+)
MKLTAMKLRSPTGGGGSTKQHQKSKQGSDATTGTGTTASTTATGATASHDDNGHRPASTSHAPDKQSNSAAIDKGDGLHNVLEESDNDDVASYTDHVQVNYEGAPDEHGDNMNETVRL